MFTSHLSPPLLAIFALAIPRLVAAGAPARTPDPNFDTLVQPFKSTTIAASQTLTVAWVTPTTGFDASTDALIDLVLLTGTATDGLETATLSDLPTSSLINPTPIRNDVSSFLWSSIPSAVVGQSFYGLKIFVHGAPTDTPQIGFSNPFFITPNEAAASNPSTSDPNACPSPEDTNEAPAVSDPLPDDQSCSIFRVASTMDGQGGTPPTPCLDLSVFEDNRCGGAGLCCEVGASCNYYGDAVTGRMKSDLLCQ